MHEVTFYALKMRYESSQFAHAYLQSFLEISFVLSMFFNNPPQLEEINSVQKLNIITV